MAPDRERYSYEEVTAEIQAFIDSAPRGTQKRLAAAAGLDSSNFRHQMAEDQGQRFSYEQIGRIAMEAGRIRGRTHGAPAGWPFIPWKDGEAIESLLHLTRVRPH